MEASKRNFSTEATASYSFRFSSGLLGRISNTFPTRFKISEVQFSSFVLPLISAIASSNCHQYLQYCDPPPEVGDSTWQQDTEGSTSITDKFLTIRMPAWSHFNHWLFQFYVFRAPYVLLFQTVLLCGLYFRNLLQLSAFPPYAIKYFL